MSVNQISIATHPVLEEPDRRFTRLASDEDLRRTAQALSGRGMRAILVDTRSEAREAGLKLIPPGSQVFTVSSLTLAQTGLAEALDESGHYASVRKDLKKLNASYQTPEMRQAGSSPDYVVGSVQAITLDGVVLDVSMTGSQLPAYAFGAGKVIWIVGCQKIVKDFDEGMQRINEYCLALENQRTLQSYGMPSAVNKILIVNREQKPDRITVILVKESLGF